MPLVWSTPLVVDTKLQEHMADNQKNDSRKGKSNRGFAAMDKDKQREIASKGGKASHGGRGRSK
jgi:general stress protein YciG